MGLEPHETRKKGKKEKKRKRRQPRGDEMKRSTSRTMIGQERMKTLRSHTRLQMEHSVSCKNPYVYILFE